MRIILGFLLAIPLFILTILMGLLNALYEAHKDILCGVWRKIPGNGMLSRVGRAIAYVMSWVFLIVFTIIVYNFANSIQYN